MNKSKEKNITTINIVILVAFIIYIFLISGCSSNVVNNENVVNAKKENTIMVEGNNVLSQGESAAYTILDSKSIIDGKEASIIRRFIYKHGSLNL